MRKPEMPATSFDTPALKRVLEESKDDAAIAEYHRMLELQHHLCTHMRIIKQQTDASIAAVIGLTNHHGVKQIK